MEKDQLRILLVDDHSLFRKGMAALLSRQASFQVVGEADNGLQALERTRALAPDVVLMDLQMPKCDGLEATRLIKQEFPHIHIIILTVSDDDHNLFTAIKNGAEGYLLKTLEPQELYEMLNRLQHGEAPISGKLAVRILDEFREMKQKPNLPQETPDALTQRETEILELVVQGLTNVEIAQALCVTENTVKIHLRNILEKLHLDNRVQAAVYAVRQGLVKTLVPNA
jgi:two-component system, NarL family, nitrate/nitrite response regulator NarL